MKKVFILLGFALLGGGSSGEVLSNGPLNGNAYTCPAYSCVSISVEMVFVQGGTLQNKNTNGTIAVGDFYIGKYEVTQKQWLDIMGSYPGTAPNSIYGLGDNYPVYYISWNDAKAFIAKLNSAGGNFRLPTEAEWEYAAKGGNPQQSYTYAGNNTIGDVAWYYYNSAVNGTRKSHPTTDLKAANAIGAYNMIGNVWEWCSDYWDSGSNTTIPTSPATSGSYRVLHGGCWGIDAMYCTVSYRYFDTPDNRGYFYGFRLACSSNP
jgi:formylglycine-generating enzyme required for sulfatase activity